jgi:3D (Asp-Asp-Asp) domain-containing protein
LNAPRKSVVRPSVALAVLLSTLVLASVATADSVGGLRQQGSDLASRERAALLDLYVLDSRLDRARADLAAVGVRTAALERERTQARLELRAARRTLAVAQRQLGGQLRVLYEHEEPDVFAVILGASSLDELITGLDGLSRAAGATNAVIDQARAARAEVLRVSRTLAERHRTLDRLQSAARARAQELQRAQVERQRYMAALREQRRLNAAQIATAESQARAAQASSQTATLTAQTSGSVTSLTAQPLVPQAEDPAVRPAAGKRLIVLATAYSLPGSTASGLPVGPGIVAVDPTVIPLGTRMTIPGYGEGVAADTGTAVKGLRIDVWFPTLAQARAWGLRSVTITLH